MMTPSAPAMGTFSASIPYSKKQRVTHFVPGTQVRQNEERNRGFRTSIDDSFMMRMTSYNSMLLYLTGASHASLDWGTRNTTSL